jgi:3-oxoacyl-[acyl-carrier-protein] synthase III
VPRFAHIVGWGKFVPEGILTNQDLERMVDTTDEWIRSRTGICERHIASPKESTSTLAIQAAQRALEVADVDPLDLDLIIVATATPDYVFPSTACLVQDALGATRAAAFDMNAACSGFIYALSTARDSIIAGTYRRVLVIGAETFSRIVNWHDRDTCVLFGDGAGAVILAGSDLPGGLLSFALGADGSGAELLIVPAGGSRHPACEDTVRQNLHSIKMNGREVFRFATRVMERASRQVAERAELKMEHVELIIPHQANGRIIQSARESLKIPAERVFSNLERYGNTSAASIPMALCEAIEEGRVQPGDHLILVGFGAGLTWGAALVEWAQPLPKTPIPRLKHVYLTFRYRWARVASFFRRAWRWVEGLGKTSTGHTQFLWLQARNGIDKAGHEIGKARQGIGKAGKDVADKAHLLRRPPDDQPPDATE